LNNWKVNKECFYLSIFDGSPIEKNKTYPKWFKKSKKPVVLL